MKKVSWLVFGVIVLFLLYVMFSEKEGFIGSKCILCGPCKKDETTCRIFDEAGNAQDLTCSPSGSGMYAQRKWGGSNCT